MALKTSVFLRRADREDMDTVVSWMDDPDFVHFLYGDPARSPKQIRESIASLLGRTAGASVPVGMYLIIDSPEYGPIGLVSLMNLSWRNRTCSMDAYIGRKDLRAGFVAGVSLFRALEYCFDELNLHRVSMYIYSFNSPSWRLVEGSGIRRELVLRQHVPRDGELHDMFGYGILRDEFEEMRSKYAGRFRGMSLADMIAAHKAGVEAFAEADR